MFFSVTVHGLFLVKTDLSKASKGTSAFDRRLKKKQKVARTKRRSKRGALSFMTPRWGALPAALRPSLRCPGKGLVPRFRLVFEVVFPSFFPARASPSSLLFILQQHRLAGLPMHISRSVLWWMFCCLLDSSIDSVVKLIELYTVNSHLSKLQGTQGNSSLN